MEGGRGGGAGRGKAKKAKAAKKKAAAAAAAQQAAVGHKKAAHGGKKVAASHANVQVVAVSKTCAAPTLHAAVEAAAAASDSTQTMSKSKRKRLKKAAGAANSLLKKQAAAQADKTKATQAQAHAQQAKKSPKVVGAASTASPTLVSMLAPAAVTGKAHVVSLTGGKKKKKRKRHAALDSADPTAGIAGGDGTAEVGTTTAAVKQGQTTDVKKSPLTTKTKKTVVVLNHSTASPSATKSTKAASPKLKIGQVNTSQMTQHAPKKKSITTTVAPAKTEVVPSPRNMVKKMKVKPTVASIKLDAAVAPASTVEPPKEVSETVVNKLRTKTEVQQPNIAVTASKSPVVTASLKATKLEATTKKREVAQMKKSSVLYQLPSVNVETSEKKDVSLAKLPKREVPTTPRKALKTTKKTTVNAVNIASTAAADEKLSSSPNVSNASAAAFFNPAQAGPTAAISLTKDAPHEKIVPQGSVPGAPATGTLPKPKTTVVTAASSPITVTTKLMQSPPAKPEAKILAPTGGLKRQRSSEQASAIADSPPAKRSVVYKRVVAIQTKAVQHAGSSDALVPTGKKSSDPGEVSRSRAQHTIAAAKQSQQAEDPVNLKETHVHSKSAAGDSRPSESASVRSVPTIYTRRKDPESQHPATKCSVKMPAKPAPEHKSPSVQIQTASSNMTQRTAKKLKPTIRRETNADATALKTGDEAGRSSVTVTVSEIAAQSKTVGIILDSHVYVQRMMCGELESSCRCDSHHVQSSQPTVALPPRPQNAWGASFGLVPPPQGASSPSRTLSTTPLSSWFLSKGCANFVKQVHFSDDDIDSCSDSDGGAVLTRHISTPRGADKASPKRRASLAKKNAFLDSLTKQSNWRSWYGNVDLHNLLDPPLANVPEKLRAHEVTPAALPEETAENECIAAPTKKANELEVLEADIRREKLQGSAFSEQLLMMLQGKTVSGKQLEEEYRPLLQR